MASRDVERGEEDNSESTGQSSGDQVNADSRSRIESLRARQAYWMDPAKLWQRQFLAIFASPHDAGHLVITTRFHRRWCAVSK